MSTEIDRGFIVARSQQHALSTLRAAVEAVLGRSESAVREWYEDYGGGHDPAGIEVPGKMQMLRDALERVAAELPKPQADAEQLRIERDHLVRERGELKERLARAIKDREWHESRFAALGRAGDHLAHQFSYSEAPAVYDAWWSARGGHEACTYCNGAEGKPAGDSGGVHRHELYRLIAKLEMENYEFRHRLEERGP